MTALDLVTICLPVWETVKCCSKLLYCEWFMFVGVPNALWTWKFRSVTARTSFINTWWPVCVPFVLHVCKTNGVYRWENNANCKINLFWDAALRLMCRNVNVSWGTYCLDIHGTLMIEAVDSSEILVSISQTTRRHIQKDSYIHIYRRPNYKFRFFYICVTVNHWYNNINSQIDATITNFIDNYNQLNMFRAII